MEHGRPRTRRCASSIRPDWTAGEGQRTLSTAMPRNLMPDGDESRLFTEDEYVKALGFMMLPEEAKERGKVHADQPYSAGDWSASPDLLALLSLVPEDCANRVAQVMGLNQKKPLSGARPSQKNSVSRTGCSRSNSALRDSLYGTARTGSRSLLSKKVAPRRPRERLHTGRGS